VPSQPVLCRTPRYCLSVDGRRQLDLGVFGSRAAAEQRWAEYQATASIQPRDWTVERIYVSRRSDR
jgi:hypothetical protein